MSAKICIKACSVMKANSKIIYKANKKQCTLIKMIKSLHLRNLCMYSKISTVHKSHRTMYYISTNKINIETILHICTVWPTFYFSTSVLCLPGYWSLVSGYLDNLDLLTSDFYFCGFFYLLTSGFWLPGYFWPYIWHLSVYLYTFGILGSGFCLPLDIFYLFTSGFRLPGYIWPLRPCHHSVYLDIFDFLHDLWFLVTWTYLTSWSLDSSYLDIFDLLDLWSQEWRLVSNPLSATKEECWTLP